MGNKTRLWAKWLSGISLALLVLGLISYSNASEVWLSEMDPSNNHLLELEPGENSIIDLEGDRPYTALRMSENGGAVDADLRLVGSDDELVDGRAPNAIELLSARPGEDGETIYVQIGRAHV